jgi:threonine dehydratase
VVTEFNYRLSGRDRAHIFVGLRTASREDAVDVPRGCAPADTTRRTLPTTRSRSCTSAHGRRPLVGRPRRAALPVRVPERPGALLRFLETLGGRWNISLFHYRNHGADFGRVLAGFEVPAAEEADFQAFCIAWATRSLRRPGNPAYELFLAIGATEPRPAVEWRRHPMTRRAIAATLRGIERMAGRSGPS